MEEIVVRCVHFISIMAVFSTLIAEHVLMTGGMNNHSFKCLLLVDAIYGMGAIVVLISGAMLWQSVGKPSAFYTSNGLFHIKLSLFVLIGLLSIIPTVFLIKNRKQAGDEIELPHHLLTIVRVEIALLLCLPIFATLMAKGVSLS